MKHTINNNIISIIFDENEVKYMMQMLKAELKEELERALKYVKKIEKAIKNNDINGLCKLDKDSHSLYSPRLTQDAIIKLEKTNTFDVSLSLLSFDYTHRLKAIEDKDFVNSFKELIRLSIEKEDIECVKIIRLEELAKV